MKKSRKISFILTLFFGISLILASGYINGNQVSESSQLTMVSHSEYWSGEQGQIIGKLYNYLGNPILANCNVTIYNPDKTIYLAPTTTDDTLEALDGTHYINFTTPTTEGIYEYMIECGFTLNNKYQTRQISNSFHLNPALNTIKQINTSVSGIGNIYPLLVNVNTTANNIYNNMFTDLNAFNNFTNIQNNFNAVNTKLDGLQTNMSTLMNYCSNPETNSSDLCRLVWENNQKIIGIETDVNYISDVQLQVINQTTQNTYNYVTGTLATNINNIYTTLLGVQTTVNEINSTVNRIDTNVLDVKTNLTTVISNQEEVVYFDVTS